MTLQDLIDEATRARGVAFSNHDDVEEFHWQETATWLTEKREAGEELLALPAELETALREWRGKAVIVGKFPSTQINADLAAAIDKYLPKEEK